MAAWQFDVELLPRTWALSPNGTRCGLTKPEGYSDPAPAWRGLPDARPRVHEALRAELGEPSERSSTWAQWGSAYTGDTFHIASEGDLILAFYVRISAVAATEASLARVLRVVEATRCVLWPRGAVEWFEPTASRLAQAVSSSIAAGFPVHVRRVVPVADS